MSAAQPTASKPDVFATPVAPAKLPGKLSYNNPLLNNTLYESDSFTAPSLNHYSMVCGKVGSCSINCCTISAGKTRDVVKRDMTVISNVQI